jgi:hypothetical protein
VQHNFISGPEQRGDFKSGFLKRASVLKGKQVMILDKSDLKEKICSLSIDRIKEILNGLRGVIEIRSTD